MNIKRLSDTMRRLFALLVLVLAFGCGDPCLNTIKSELTSPDGRYVATAFVRDCGATTGFSPQVDLRSVGERRAPTGNVFVGDHSDQIRIEWVSASHLVIYADCAVVLHERRFNGIVVEKRAGK